MPGPRVVLAAALTALALTGCGSDGSAAAPGGRSDRLVDFSKKPPYVNALDVDPATGDFLLTTNRGFWRIDPKTGTVARVRGTIAARGKSATVGTFLELLVTGPGQLIGSGHPDRAGTLPAFLGLISSADGGKSWKVISRLGDADLHKILIRHDRMYAFDAVLGAMLVSRDGGRTFVENFTPKQLVIDFEVDPRDAEQILASTEGTLFRSSNGGKSWRGVATADGIRLAWPAPDALYRAERDGTVSRSSDAGSTWKRVGTVPGEPYKFKIVGPERLFLALSDGAIVETRDGGREWKSVFKP